MDPYEAMNSGHDDDHEDNPIPQDNALPYNRNVSADQEPPQEPLTAIGGHEQGEVFNEPSYQPAAPAIPGQFAGVPEASNFGLGWSSNQPYISNPDYPKYYTESSDRHGWLFPELQPAFQPDFQPGLDLPQFGSNTYLDTIPPRLSQTPVPISSADTFDANTFLDNMLSSQEFSPLSSIPSTHSS